MLGLVFLLFKNHEALYQGTLKLQKSEYICLLNTSINSQQIGRNEHCGAGDGMGGFNSRNNGRKNRSEVLYQLKLEWILTCKYTSDIAVLSQIDRDEYNQKRSTNYHPPECQRQNVNS